MADFEWQSGWPELDELVAALRRAGEPAVADLLVDAVRAGATGSEVLGSLGVVLRDHHALRARLGDADRQAWDAVMAAVRRAYPGSRLGDWLAWLTRRTRLARS